MMLGRGRGRCEMLLLAVLLPCCGGVPRWKRVHVLVDDDVMDFPKQEAKFDEAFMKGCGHASEMGQEQWVLDLLADRKEGGFFVEVGAHGGFYCSNTVRLEEDYGWKGLCIEPGPKSLWSLAHRKCTVVSALIDHAEGYAEFNDRPERDSHAGIVRNDTYNTQSKKSETFFMPTVSMSRVLHDMGAPRVIDYMSLDVEGAEQYVLKGFPWNEHEVHIMTVEETEPEAEAILEQQGYERLFRIRHDDLWVLKSWYRELSATRGVLAVP